MANSSACKSNRLLTSNYLRLKSVETQKDQFRIDQFLENILEIERNPVRAIFRPSYTSDLILLMSLDEKINKCC